MTVTHHGYVCCLQYKDLLQLMIDATGEEDEGNETQGDECPASKLRKMKGAMTDTEVFANAVGFLGAGLETTATALSFASYLLALHPDVQEKLQSEIDDYFEEKPVSENAMHCSSGRADHHESM